MTFQKLTPDDIEYFTLITNPRRTYVSSSDFGITGSVYLFSRRSLYEKDIYPIPNISSSVFFDQNLDEIRKDVLRATGSLNITSYIETYVSAVNSQQNSQRKKQKLEIYRFNPPFRFNSNFLRKKILIDNIMPYYRVTNPFLHYNVTNYNCLNFYTASNVPTSSVILYPNPVKNPDLSQLSAYGFSGSFSFDFWIKPKYYPDLTSSHYRPGCIMHLTGAYAVCLHSGSSRDINGNINRYRISLQLSSSANIAPTLITETTPNVFFSVDNAIERDKWNHVTIRWGGTNYNNGSGSFIVNGKEKGTFVINSNLEVGNLAIEDSTVLCVGNYYEGDNNANNALTYFFTNETAEREGLYELQNGTGFAPANFAFNYPLNAEIHELKLYNKYLNDIEIKKLETDGASIVPELLFYLPPFFTKESPIRKFHGGFGGVPVTPFFTKNGTTDTLFAKEMAFGCGGHFINLENYVRDFATGRYGRLWNLTSSIYNQTTNTSLSANELLYSTGSNIKRLYTILPCDNGKFTPNFQLLSTLNTSSFVNDLGNYEPGVVTLRNIITGAFSSDVIVEETSSIAESLIGGSSPENLGSVPGDSLAIYHRTRDGSSNQVVLFDISNLFYGLQIKPGSIVIKDNNLLYSDNKLKITLRDNGLGNLYRADAEVDLGKTHATWASCGNVFYNEGLILIKMPQLYFFGEKQFEIEFQGIQNIHVMTINAYAKPLQLISSSNPSYVNEQLLNEPANINDQKYVYITHLNVHDDNLNVIMRTALAQPLLKRTGDKFKFKIKLDF